MKKISPFILILLGLGLSWPQMASAQSDSSFRRDMRAIVSDLEEWTRHLKSYWQENGTDTLSADLQQEMRKLGRRWRALEERYDSLAQSSDSLSPENQAAWHDAMQTLSEGMQNLSRGMQELGRSLEKLGRTLRREESEKQQPPQKQER